MLKVTLLMALRIFISADRLVLRILEEGVGPRKLYVLYVFILEGSSLVELGGIRCKLGSSDQVAGLARQMLEEIRVAIEDAARQHHPLVLEFLTPSGRSLDAGYQVMDTPFIQRFTEELRITGLAEGVKVLKKVA